MLYFSFLSSQTFFFFHDTPPTEIYTLSLTTLFRSIPRLPPTISSWRRSPPSTSTPTTGPSPTVRDRKSTRLNSSHLGISYAVFCLKKKKSHNDAALREGSCRGYSVRRPNHTNAPSV